MALDPGRPDVPKPSKTSLRGAVFVWETVIRAAVWSVIGTILWFTAHAAGLAPLLNSRQFLYLVAVGAWIATDHAGDDWESSEPQGSLLPYARRLVIDGCFGVLFAVALSAVLEAPLAQQLLDFQITDYLPFVIGAVTQGLFNCAARRREWPALAPIKDIVDAAALGALASLAMAFATGKVMAQGGSYDDTTLTVFALLGAGAGVVIAYWQQSRGRIQSS
jgi:hypothetical protein